MKLWILENVVQFLQLKLASPSERQHTDNSWSGRVFLYMMSCVNSLANVVGCWVHSTQQKETFFLFHCNIFDYALHFLSSLIALVEYVKFAWSCRAKELWKCFSKTKKNVSHQSPRKINCLIVTNNLEQQTSNEGSKWRLSWCLMACIWTCLMALIN